jgi:glycosyltransferase involved in cell wall biosynthesis
VTTRPEPRPRSVLLPHQLAANRFLLDLAKAYRTAGLDVIVGREHLRHRLVQPDVLHLHWPEEHYRWAIQPGESREEAADAYIAGIDWCKQHGAVVVWQVHNVYPHEHESNPLDRHVYQQVIDRADVLLHHCAESARLVRERYRVPPGVSEIVIPLGDYTSYRTTLTSQEARARLSIPIDAQVYLHFGKIRAYKGLDVLLREFRKVKVPRKLLVVAGEYRRISTDGRLRQRVTLAIMKRLATDVRFHLGLVPESEVELYLAACDVVVLSHRSGLNSGVAVLGMSFGKVVVGPATGCIGPALEAGLNAVYDPSDPDGLRAAMEKAVDLDRHEVARANLAAVAGWNWNSFVARLLDALPVGR